MSDVREIYAQRVSICKAALVKLKRRLAFISFIRVFSFLLAVVSAFYFSVLSVLLAIALAGAFLSMFLWSVKKYAKISKLKDFEQHKYEINQQELIALDHQFQQFDDGKEFIDPNHFYTYDLDFFGRGSLFQYLNRTVSAGGKVTLADRLGQPMLNANTIYERQCLVKELSSDIDWRHDFAASGKMHAETNEERHRFLKWGSDSFSLRTFGIANVLLVLLPVFAFVSIMVWAISGSSLLFILSTILQVSFWMVEKNNIKTIYGQFGKRLGFFQKIACLLNMIETRSWVSNEGKSMVDGLKRKAVPSIEIKKLEKILAAFDNRNNMFVGVILNITLAWDILCCYRIINWHNRNKAHFKDWEEAIALTDATCSMANFSFNHRGYVYAGFDVNDFEIEAIGLGHPLIHPQKRIVNQFAMHKPNSMVIVTGANMSGKSTFLRTVGVNMVLAMCGAPVCAQKLVFKPVALFSNMRTTDSLFDDESYFFAELKRIKLLLNEIDKGGEVFIILDEILKGTNSEDKYYGSLRLIERLIKTGTPTMLATHDLKLTELEKGYHGRLVNKCFEITIDNNEMHFDYLLRDGVTTMMNATFLMKKMGIIEEQ
jgi:hypothetical protein